MSTWSNTENGILVVGTAAAAVLVYAIGDVLSALLYDGYSYADQAISELSAFGSPAWQSSEWPTAGSCGGSVDS